MRCIFSNINTGYSWWKMSAMLLATLTMAMVCSVRAANILAVLPACSPSHYIWSRALPLELARRGHHVTIVSPNRIKETAPNVTEILLEGSYETTGFDFNYETDIKNSVWRFVIGFHDWGKSACEYQFTTNGMEKLINLTKHEKFDLILMETLVNECFFQFIPAFGDQPTIALSGFELQIWVSYMVGNPEPFAYVRNSNFPFTDKMTFTERLTNTVMNLFYMFYRNYIAIPQFQKIAEKYLGPSDSPILEIEKRFSLVLANFIPGIDYTRPLLPNIIPVGGMHIEEPKKLPKDVQEYLDDASNGAILFSLGTNLKSSKLTETALKAILEAFSELPQKILWKFEADYLPGKPDNVKIFKWLPQTDVLAHPNVRLFISHCGLMSTQETMYRGVPVVGIPFYADQRANLHKMKNYGFAEDIEFSMLTKETLLRTIEKVLYTSSYTENVKRISSVFRDQPEPPLDRAVFWTEYVLRHKGAPHLRSAALDLEWYQYFLLDVIVVLLLGALVTLWIFYIVTKTIFRMVFGKKSKMY